ncbi:MAG: nucleoside hydrolase [Anaerolineae bacterium]|nr:nucleoside hydrolase [Anaerolineae bacterium]
MFAFTYLMSMFRTGRAWKHWGIIFIAVIIACVLLIPIAAIQAEGSAVKLLIDTDPGVDDAAALVWLLSQKEVPVEVLGITTVVGNAEVGDTTNNVLTLLDVLERTDIPVVMGAAAPLAQPNSHTSALLHGPDGLWFVGWQNPHDLTGIPNDVPAFYCDQVAEPSNTTVLALGPLTNLANAVSQCPDKMRSFRQIIILGGSKTSNAPLTDYNFWQDPEAADIVLSAGLPVTIVTLEARTKFTLSQKDLKQLAKKGNEAAQLIVGPMQLYADALTGFDGGGEAAFDDVAAAIYGLKPSLGAAQSGLVKIVTEPSLARGQSVIGLTFSDRISLIASPQELSDLVDQAFADPNFDLFGALLEILAREPDNAQVVLDINAKQMQKVFMKALTK